MKELLVKILSDAFSIGDDKQKGVSYVPFQVEALAEQCYQHGIIDEQELYDFINNDCKRIDQAWPQRSTSGNKIRRLKVESFLNQFIQPKDDVVFYRFVKTLRKMAQYSLADKIIAMACKQMFDLPTIDEASRDLQQCLQLRLHLESLCQSIDTRVRCLHVLLGIQQ